MKKYLSLMFVFIMMLGLMTPVLAATSAKNYRVSVSKTTGGTVDGAGSYKKGEMVTLTAKAKTGYEFTGWNKLNGVEVDDATEAEITFKMPGKKVSMKANFTKIPTYKVSVSKNGGGTVDGVGSYKEGTTVTLIAEAKTGYEFTGWSKLNGVEVDDATEAEITFIMPASKVSMTANFKKVPMYKVTVSKTSGGSVEGAGSYKEGATVTLTAEPKSGYEFVGWSNIKGIKIEDKTDEVLEFTMPTVKVSIKAEFAKNENKVTVSKTSGGSVDGEGSYKKGQLVTLTAEAEDGYEFVDWDNIKGIDENEINTVNETIEFTMPLGSVSMKATFAKIANKVTASANGGTVDGIGTYDRGEIVTLVAEAKSDYEFVGWTIIKGIDEKKIDTTSETIEFEMPLGEVNLKANFGKIPTYKVAVSKITGGTVDGVGNYKEGDQVTLTVKNKIGYDFEGWTIIEGIDKISRILQIEVDTNERYFIDLDEYGANEAIVSIVSGDEFISVNKYKMKSSGKIEITAKEEGIAIIKVDYDTGDMEYINIEVVDEIENEKVKFIMPANDVRLRSNFVQIPTNKVVVSRTTGGTVEGIGTYEVGKRVTLTAEAKTGYEFVEWTNIEGLKIIEEDLVYIKLGTNEEYELDLDEYGADEATVSIVSGEDYISLSGTTFTKKGDPLDIIGEKIGEAKIEISYNSGESEYIDVEVGKDAGVYIDAENERLRFSMPANDVKLKANFIKVPINKVVVNKTAGGTVEGEGTYREGEKVKLEATAKKGYQFVKWTNVEGIEIDKDELGESEITFKMPENKVSLKAVFEEKSPVLQEAYDDLEDLGLIKIEDSEFDSMMTENVSRAQMAALLSRMVGADDDLINEYKNITWNFSDVETNVWYTGYINFAMRQGLMTGFPDGTFRPNDTLTTNQAITYIVKALGRGRYVERQGTWPSNYVNDAESLGITEDLIDHNTNILTYDNLIIMVHSALDVGTWEISSVSDDNKEVTLKKGDSLRELYFEQSKISTEVIYENAWEDLEELGIVAPDVYGNHSRVKLMTRAEVIVQICRMMGDVQKEANNYQNMDTGFVDVLKGEWYTGWVNLALQNGIIENDTEKNFRPNEYATFNEVVEMMIKAVGRWEYVSQQGSKPANYILDAKKIGITKDTYRTASNIVDNGNVVIMLANTLDVGTWGIKSVSIDGEIILKGKDSFREIYFE